MIRTSFFTSLLFIPSFAFALNYSDATAQFTDSSRLSTAEKAGVNVLVHVGAIQGNPDGTFAAGRTLNRAEFLKIVLASNPDILVTNADAENCFPDVRSTDWFSKYICLAKKRGIIGGYPDGTFKPGNDVNYAEALKMLAEVYNLDLPAPPANERWMWYTAYVRAAENEGLTIDGINPEDLLTRGHMARLAAAYLAHSEGELSLYRDSEQGITSSTSSSSSSSLSNSSSSSSSVSSASSASSDSSSSQSSTSSSSSQSSTALFPAYPRFLVAGELTPLITDGVFTQSNEDAGIIRVEVEFVRKVRSVKELVLVDDMGDILATVPAQLTNNDDDTRFRVELDAGEIEMKAGEPVRLGLKARMYTANDGAISSEYLQVKSWLVWTEANTSHTIAQLSPSNWNIPQHQTSLARITSMQSLLSSQPISEGSAKQIGLFTVSVETATGAQTRIDSLNFRLERANVSLQNIRIGKPGQESQSCSLQESGEYSYVYCALSPSAGAIDASSSIDLSILADLGTTALGGTVQLSVFQSNTIGSDGTLVWSDGAGIFSWVETGTQMDSGPVISVTEG